MSIMNEKLLDTPSTSDNETESIDYPSENPTPTLSEHDDDEIIKPYLESEKIQAKKIETEEIAEKKFQVEARERYGEETNIVKKAIIPVQKRKNFKENEHNSIVVAKKKKSNPSAGKRKIKKQLIINSYVDESCPENKKNFYDININLKEARSSHKEVINYLKTYQDGYNNVIGSDFGFSNCKEGLPSGTNKAYLGCNNFLQKTGGTTKGFFFFSGEKPITYYNDGKPQLSKKRHTIVFPIEIAYSFFTQEGLHDSILQHAKSMLKNFKEVNTNSEARSTKIIAKDIFIVHHINPLTKSCHAYIIHMSLYHYYMSQVKTATPYLSNIMVYLMHADNDVLTLKYHNNKNRVVVNSEDTNNLIHVARKSNGYSCDLQHFLNILKSTVFQSCLNTATTDLGITKLSSPKNKN